MEEVFKAVPGYSGRYRVSNLGRVFRTTFKSRNGREWKARELKGTIVSTGYRMIALSTEDREVAYKTVHSIVMETFVGPLTKGQVTRHLDGDKLNNRLDNLAYGTQRDNYEDSVRHGTAMKFTTPRATHCKRGHELNEQNVVGDDRSCRACTLARQWANREGREFTQEKADEYFEDLELGFKCKRGHRIVEWNTYTSGGCRACALAKAHAARRGEPFSQEVADEKYRALEQNKTPVSYKNTKV